jgi:hypothetical protein
MLHSRAFVIRPLETTVLSSPTIPTASAGALRVENNARITRAIPHIGLRLII